MRIIAGLAGGRRLAVPPGTDTRPTTDRVREALFSALASWAGTGGEPAETSLAGLAFCDLYAGSGGVGLEAASRGASPVLLVEADRDTAALAVRNAADLGLQAEIRTARVEQLVSRPASVAFDIVFADPPYDLTSDQVRAVLSAMMTSGWLARGGLAVAERSRRAPWLGWPDSVAQTWSRRYGETVLEFAVADSLPAAEGGS